MVAVSKGFIDIVTTLHVCPLIEINHQDNDGNTALMIAAQAGVCAVLHHRASHPNRLTWRTVFDVGFVNILNYIINFYAGVDTEVRDPRGFTALIKAGLQGREECVAALLMHGEDGRVLEWLDLKFTTASNFFSFPTFASRCRHKCDGPGQRQKPQGLGAEDGRL